MHSWKVLILIAVSSVAIAHKGHAVQKGFTISPSYFISSLTKNLTLRCDLGPYIHAVSRAMVLQLSKIDQQSVATLATEQQSGPTLVATALKNRSLLEGKMDPSDLPGTYIQMTLMNPVKSDSGRYMCSMTVMDHTDLIMTLTFNSTVSLENATVDALLDHVNGLHRKIEEVTSHLVHSKNRNKVMGESLAALEGQYHNMTQRSSHLEGEIERLTENVRQLQSDQALMSSNMTCPTSCIEEMDRMDERLNGSVALIQSKMTDLIHSREKTSRVVFFARHTNVPTGLIPLHHAKIIKFQEAVLNEGGGYNNKTGVFIAPVNGTYVFMLNIPIMDKDTSRQFNIAITVNFDQTIAQIENDIDKIPSSVTVVTHLAAGSEVAIQSYQLTGSQGNAAPMFSKYSSYFGGFLLYED